MAPTIHLRAGASGRLRKMLNCGTDGEFAQVLGIHVSHLSRLYNRKASPGPTFIARVLLATQGRAKFEDLFEVVDDRPTAHGLKRAS